MEIAKKYHISTINHMTHIDNLDTIFQHGLYAHNNDYKKVDISNNEVNNRREKLEGVFHRNVHDYVPFYFNPRNAMMYRNRFDNVVVLGFSNKLMLASDTLFTNKNAATNSARFFHDINELNTINWNYVWSNAWNNYVNREEIKQTMMAEVLVHSYVSIKNLVGIYVKDRAMQNYLMQRYNLPSSRVKINPNMFFM